MTTALRTLFSEIQALEVRVQETNVGNDWIKEAPVVYTIDTAPSNVPCHSPHCPTHGGFSLLSLVRRMVRRRESHRQGFAACMAAGPGEEKGCINYFHYAIAIAYGPSSGEKRLTVRWRAASPS